MEPRFVLTPYFLDHHLPGLEVLKDPRWVINKPNLPEEKPQIRMATLYRPLAELVATILDSGELPISIAGDCCTSIGFLAGLQRVGLQPSLIWLDAHGDFNTWETTPSGFVGGMPLAMLVGRGEQTILERVGTHPMVEKQVILSDARDLDPGERIALGSSEVTRLQKVQDFYAHQLPGGPIWVHFDTDLIDSSQAPAMNYPVPGGPDLDELSALFRFLNSSGQLVGVSLSSWNPELDGDGQTRQVCMRLLTDLVYNYH